MIGAEDTTNRRLCTTTSDVLFESGCALRAADGGAWEFQAYWDLVGKNAKNGDRYRATLTSSEVVLLDADVNATYAESEPNGESCGIARKATL